MLLPDADVFCERVRRAAADGERALVFGDFDADGLTGLAILTLALRTAGDRHRAVRAEPYSRRVTASRWVPSSALVPRDGR